jgi:hypothetical protein
MANYMLYAVFLNGGFEVPVVKTFLWNFLLLLVAEILVTIILEGIFHCHCPLP